MSVHSQSRPAWQTDELQDEWVDLEEGESAISHNTSQNDSLTRSISLTAPLATYIHTNSDAESDDDADASQRSAAPVGTFVVHEDKPAPLLPKTPARGKKNNLKNIFTPLPLERMFDPPTPPQHKTLPTPEQNPTQPLQESLRQETDEILETDIPDMHSFHGRKASMSCQFTFTAPRPDRLNPNASRSYAESTPTPPFAPNGAAPPSTEPPLRLFQFQYDTYTREHLSALVDSIAINTPSGSAFSPTAMNHVLSKVSEQSGSRNHSFSDFRSAKRVKLSPPGDFADNERTTDEKMPDAVVTRPRLYGKDYVGASRSLMQQIKEARDFSTISSVAGGQQRTPGTTSAARSDTSSTKTAKPDVPAKEDQPNRCSSSIYRMQAAALMAQIKSDMKGVKRQFTGDTESSYVSSAREESVRGTEDKEKRGNSLTRRSFRRTPSMASNSSERLTRSTPPRLSLQTPNGAVNTHRDVLKGLSKLSIHDSLPQAPPIQVHMVRMPPLILAAPNSQSSRPPSALGLQPSRPSTRTGVHEDMNRFVSSSTASGTTLTTSSVPSFVKHAGPAQIRTIAPSDVPALPDRMGDMVFDRMMMRWVKTTDRAASGGGMAGYLPSEHGSEDPFEGIESLRDDSRLREDPFEGIESLRDDAPVGETEEQPRDPEDEPHELSLVEERSEFDEVENVHDEVEMELTSFSTDASSRIVEVMTGVESGEEYTDSEDNPPDEPVNGIIPEPASDSEDDMETHPAERIAETHLAPPPPMNHLLTPAKEPAVPSTSTTPIKSALKGGTPSSGRGVQKYYTPLRSAKHRRSVSFSDGKRDGQIRGLGRNFSPSEGPASQVPSARSKRIADMMQALENSDSDDADSPSKTLSNGERPDELQPLSARGEVNSSKAGHTPGSRRVFSRSPSLRPSVRGDSRGGNATFLTECSFAVAHDRLVQVITDVEPFEPHWENLPSIDLSGKRIESAARLKEFLPRLDSLNMNSNQLSWLSGVPGTVRTLSVAHNCLTGVTSFNHLLNLESLDISRNGVDSLRQLSCLRHLRELRADGNEIASIEGLENMSSLVKLSLRGNALRSVDLTGYRWSRLEMLDLGENRLSQLAGLTSLRSLIALNVDDNKLEKLRLPAGEGDGDGALPKLRILRASGNRLRGLDVGGVPGLRTLYLDNNALRRVANLGRLARLENLSVRNQSSSSGEGEFEIVAGDVRDVKRIYLSGNPLGGQLFAFSPSSVGAGDTAFYHLVYVELAACRLRTLPADLCKKLPNVRALNLNYNFLEDGASRALEGMGRLRKLTVVGSRVGSARALVRVLRGMGEVEMVDFRMNPCTLGWYLPLLVRDVPGALQPSEDATAPQRDGGAAWAELDAKFRRDLPDEAYMGRLAYRGLVMEACPRVRMLDGVAVTPKERAKARELLEGIVGRRRGDAGAR